MTPNKKILIAVGLIVLAGGFAWYSMASTPTVSAPQGQQVATSSSYAYGQELSEAEVLEATDEILALLDQLYFVTQDTSSSVEPDSTSVLIIQMTTESLVDKSTIDDLLPRAQKLADSDNEVISMVGMGLFVGLSNLTQAESDFVQFLRTVDPINPDLAEFQYQMAAFNSAQKEAFKLISMSAGQLPILFWDAPETENPTGPISYRLSTEGRQHILAEIERLFADDIIEDERNHSLTGSTNAVIFIVKTYRDSLIPDTYEEIPAE